MKTVNIEYQWKRNGTNIPGATRLEYETLITQGDMSGAKISVVETITTAGRSEGIESEPIIMGTPPIVVLDQDYGRTQYRQTLQHTLLDCKGGRWELSNIEAPLNRYPVFVDDDSHDVIMQGGEIHGNISLTGDWSEIYINSAAVYARNSSNILMKDWIVSQVWDGFRMGGADGAPAFQIENCWVHVARDDAVENERCVEGEISDCLFDHVFSGISLTHSNTSAADYYDREFRIFTVRDTIIRMHSFLRNGKIEQQPPFKLGDESCQLRLFNTVLAVDAPTMAGGARWPRLWNKLRSESEGNYLLNLSDTPLSDPGNPPAAHAAIPPAGSGFTLLEGQKARDFWEMRKAAWLAARGYAPKPFPRA